MKIEHGNLVLHSCMALWLATVLLVSLCENQSIRTCILCACIVKCHLH